MWAYHKNPQSPSIIPTCGRQLKTIELIELLNLTGTWLVTLMANFFQITLIKRVKIGIVKKAKIVRIRVSVAKRVMITWTKLANQFCNIHYLSIFYIEFASQLIFNSLISGFKNDARLKSARSRNCLKFFTRYLLWKIWNLYSLKKDLNC